MRNGVILVRPKQNKVPFKIYQTQNNGRVLINIKFISVHTENCFSAGKILTPKMTELLEPLDDIDLAVVDVDSNIDLVNTFEVKAVPAILAFRNGVVVDKFIGLVDSGMIENLIKKLQKKKES